MQRVHGPADGLPDGRAEPGEDVLVAPGQRLGFAGEDEDPGQRLVAEVGGEREDLLRVHAVGLGRHGAVRRFRLDQGQRAGTVAALTADLATENDAVRLARSGAPVQQVLTDGLCHLEARQVRARLDGWLPDDTAVLFVENVGNLVCPASYDLGETLRIVLMAVTEGEDKPLKYPTAFGSAHLVVITKTDLAGPAGFDEAAFRANVERVNPGVEVVRSCARTGDGVDTLLEHALAARTGAPAHHPPLAPHPHHHHHDDADAPHGHGPHATVS